MLSTETSNQKRANRTRSSSNTFGPRIDLGFSSPAAAEYDRSRYNSRFSERTENPSTSQPCCSRASSRSSNGCYCTRHNRRSRSYRSPTLSEEQQILREELALCQRFSEWWAMERHHTSEDRTVALLRFKEDDVKGRTAFIEKQHSCRAAKTDNRASSHVLYSAPSWVSKKSHQTFLEQERNTSMKREHQPSSTPPCFRVSHSPFTEITPPTGPRFPSRRLHFTGSHSRDNQGALNPNAFKVPSQTPDTPPPSGSEEDNRYVPLEAYRPSDEFKSSHTTEVRSRIGKGSTVDRVVATGVAAIAETNGMASTSPVPGTPLLIGNTSTIGSYTVAGQKDSEISTTSAQSLDIPTTPKIYPPILPPARQYHPYAPRNLPPQGTALTVRKLDSYDKARPQTTSGSFESENDVTTTNEIEILESRHNLEVPSLKRKPQSVDGFSNETIFSTKKNRVALSEIDHNKKFQSSSSLVSDDVPSQADQISAAGIAIKIVAPTLSDRPSKGSSDIKTTTSSVLQKSPKRGLKRRKKTPIGHRIPAEWRRSGEDVFEIVVSDMDERPNGETVDLASAVVVPEGHTEKEHIDQLHEPGDDYGQDTGFDDTNKPKDAASVFMPGNQETLRVSKKLARKARLSSRKTKLPLAGTEVSVEQAGNTAAIDDSGISSSTEEADEGLIVINIESEPEDEVDRFCDDFDWPDEPRGSAGNARRKALPATLLAKFSTDECTNTACGVDLDAYFHSGKNAKGQPAKHGFITYAGYCAFTISKSIPKGDCWLRYRMQLLHLANCTFYQNKASKLHIAALAIREHQGFHFRSNHKNEEQNQAENLAFGHEEPARTARIVNPDDDKLDKPHLEGLLIAQTRAEKYARIGFTKATAAVKATRCRLAEQ